MNINPPLYLALAAPLLLLACHTPSQFNTAPAQRPSPSTTIEHIANARVDHHSAVHPQHGLIWVVWQENPANEPDDLWCEGYQPGWTDCHFIATSSSPAHHFCNQELAQLWPRLQTLLAVRLAWAQEEPWLAPECTENTCTFLPPGEYGAFVQLDFDHSGYLRAVLLYTNDATIDDHHREIFRQQAFAFRDGLSNETCP